MKLKDMVIKNNSLRTRIGKELSHKDWLIVCHDISYICFSMWKSDVSIKLVDTIELSFKNDKLVIDSTGGYKKDVANEALPVLNTLLDKDITHVE